MSDKKKVYLVYTTQGYTQDPKGEDVENMQILDFFESSSNMHDVAADVKNRMINGEYGNFTSFILREMSKDFIIKAVK
jgi:hypothetical protein